jgi:hypothetical protein
MSSRVKKILLWIVGVVVVLVVIMMVMPPPTFTDPVTIDGCLPARGCNCENRNLSYITASSQTWTNCQLSNTNFSRSNVSNGKFDNANLTGANFTNANLSGANLSHANLTSAIMISVTTDSNTIFCQTTMPDGTIRTDPGRSC